jgi:hypothetical protein
MKMFVTQQNLTSCEKLSTYLDSPISAILDMLLLIKNYFINFAIDFQDLPIGDQSLLDPTGTNKPEIITP